MEWLAYSITSSGSNASSYEPMAMTAKSAEAPNPNSGADPWAARWVGLVSVCRLVSVQ
jgi:hypothetical protein